YDRSIFFKIPPFEVDSLNSDEEQAIAFDGSFVSGGIFPEFKERLVVMPDQSLGFEHRIPSEGYPIYGKKNARFHTKLTLNYSGLRGNGEFEYLSTKLFSDDIVFYKDSLIAAANSGTVDEADINKVHFPDVTMGSTEFRFYPKRDSLGIISTSEPFEVYHNNVIVNGSISVMPKGLKGEGTIDYDKTTTFSDNIAFGENKIVVRESVMELKSDNPSKAALLSKNVKGVFDIATKTIDVSPEIVGALSNEFPYSQYKTSIGQLKIDLKSQQVIMKRPKETDITKSFFFSTHPDQDSLKFFANAAVYDMKKYTLNISGVPFILVGDIKVLVDSNKVTILENANMLPFKNARLIIDSTNKFFKLYNGAIQIISRKKLEGTATYDYTVSAKQKSKVKFNEYVYKEYT
ncbi:MAG: hypothetical protein K2Q22_01270, partial [Cytophagales bacterium]|nr:hypothetical protein [Cytophagales bacterium]